MRTEHTCCSFHCVWVCDYIWHFIAATDAVIITCGVYIFLAWKQRAKWSETHIVACVDKYNRIVVCIIYCHLFWMSVWNWASLCLLARLQISGGFKHMCLCMSACTRGRARVVSAHLHFSFLFSGHGCCCFDTLSTIISLGVCEHKWVPKFCHSILGECCFLSALLTSVYKYAHSLTIEFAMSACVRMSRGCIFSTLTHFFSYCFVLGGFCLCVVLFSRTALTHCMCACVCTYLCLYAHSFRFYWVNLDFERIPFGFNTFAFFHLFFSFFARAQPKRKSAKSKTKKSSNEIHCQLQPTARPV